jgi:hypothetical protein
MFKTSELNSKYRSSRKPKLVFEQPVPDDCQFVNEQIAVPVPSGRGQFELFGAVHHVAPDVLVNEMNMPVVLRTKKARLDLDKPFPFS